MKLPTTAVLAGIGLSVSSQAALTMLNDPINSSASSQFSGTFAAAHLFDGSPSLADVGSAAANGQQYAGAGLGPHVLVWDMGSPINLAGIFYAQRLGGDPSLDKVTGIRFWFEDSDPGAASTALPGALGASDHALTLTNTSDNNLTAYDFGALVGSGRWVVMELTGNGGNPGGSELQLATDLTLIPEPSSAILIGLASGLVLLRRRK